MKINKVGIAGSGAMGAGIAQVALLAGHTVVLYDKDESMLSKALDSVKKGF